MKAIRYTIEEKEEFIEYAEQIEDAMEKILTMRGNGEIVNQVGLKHYPFDQSFDEMRLRVSGWVDGIENDIFKSEKKRTAKQGA